MGEFDLLAKVYASNAALPASVFVPPGDDLGAMRLASPSVLLGVDQLVDGRHIDLDACGAEAAGRKVVARAVSDVAAMAAHPQCALAAVVLPAHMPDADALALFGGMRDAARAFGAPLIGGDIARSGGPLSCAVTVVATPGPAGVVQRGGAQPGDTVYVTGRLGGAWRDGATHHLTFVPRVAAALALATELRANLHAMIDLSDGLGRDAGHLAEESRVALVIEPDAIPMRAGASVDEALADGEDYELLFAAAGAVPHEVPDGQGGMVPVSRIGRVVGDSVGAFLRRNGQRVDVSRLGFEH